MNPTGQFTIFEQQKSSTGWRFSTTSICLSADFWAPKLRNARSGSLHILPLFEKPGGSNGKRTLAKPTWQRSEEKKRLACWNSCWSLTWIQFQWQPVDSAGQDKRLVKEGKKVRFGREKKKIRKQGKGETQIPNIVFTVCPITYIACKESNRRKPLIQWRDHRDECCFQNQQVQVLMRLSKL